MSDFSKHYFTPNANSQFSCPHCGKAQEDQIGDYVVPNKVGQASAVDEECSWCCGEFTVYFDGANYCVDRIEKSE